MLRKEFHLKIRIAAILLLIISFCILTVLVLNGGLAAFENDVYTWFVQFMSPTLTNIMIAVTNMGSTAAVITVTVIFLTLPFSRVKFGFPIVVSTIVTALLNSALKYIIARPRPDILWLITETGYGFPSGHAMNNAALYTMIMLIAFRQTKSNPIRIPVLISGIVIPLLIGISRIYLGVHNAGDVLAGWIMGICMALLVDTVYEAFIKNYLFK